MNCVTPQDLKKLIDLCRSEGVVHFKSPDVEFVLGPKPPDMAKATADATKKDPEDDIERALFETGAGV